MDAANNYATTPTQSDPGGGLVSSQNKGPLEEEEEQRWICFCCQGWNGARLQALFFFRK